MFILTTRSSVQKTLNVLGIEGLRGKNPKPEMLWVVVYSPKGPRTQKIGF